ncbi:putative bystin [Helianthus annuus]|nr:putative bystin [Helianthus annuus]
MLYHTELSMRWYKHELTKEQKDGINYLVKKQRHKMVTPEILRELNHSRNRGEEANGSFDSRLARSQRQHDLDFWPCFWIRRGTNMPLQAAKVPKQLKKSQTDAHPLQTACCKSS